MANKIQYRRDLAANWTASNPILALGEPGYETDTKKEKIGDGVTAWTSLSYRMAPSNNVVITTDANAALTEGQILFVVSPAWSPSQIPGVQVWYDAQRQTAANGASLGSITDYSGQARHASQAVAGNQPVMNTAGINGKSAFQFLESSARRATTGTLAAPIAAGALTVIAIGKSAATATAQFVFNATSSNGQDVGMFKSATTGTMNMNRSQVVTAPTGDSNPHLWVGEFGVGASASTLSIDGSTVATGTTADANDITAITFGARNDGLRYWNGAIGEFIIVSGILTAGEKTALRTYAQEKWGTP